VPVRKELKRGLIALAILCGVGIATFATVAHSSTFVAARLKQAR
jgi:hypothetical protein